MLNQSLKMANTKKILPEIMMGLFFFLLSADILNFPSPIGKFKFAYLFLPYFLMQISLKELFKGSLKYLWVLFLILSIINSTFSHAIKDSLIGYTYWGFDLLLAFSFFQISKKNDFNLHRVFQIALSLIVLFAGAQYLAWNVFEVLIFNPFSHNGNMRLNGLSFYPNFLNVFIFFFFPAIFLKEHQSTFDKVLSAVSLFVIYNSTAKTGWVLGGVTLISLFYFLPNQVAARRLLQTVVLLFIIGFIPTRSLNQDDLSKNNLNPTVDKIRFFANDTKLSSNSSSKDRLYIARQGLLVLKDYPLFGVGQRAYDNFILGLSDMDRKVYENDGNFQLFYIHHENIWIEILAEQGFLGAILTLYGIYCFIIRKKFLNQNPESRVLRFSLLSYFFISGLFVQNILIMLPYSLIGILWGRHQK